MALPLLEAMTPAGALSAQARRRNVRLIAMEMVHGAAGSTTSWTVTADTQGFVNGGANNGWEIQDNGAGAATTGSYDSREGTNKPALSITYYP